MADVAVIPAFSAQCVCGKRLAVGAAQVGRHVVCPACSRVVVPVLAEPLALPADGGRTLPAESAGSPPAPQRSGNDTVPLAVDDSAAVFVLRVSQWDNFWKYVTCVMVEVMACGLFVVPSLRPWAGAIVGGISAVVVATALFVFMQARMTRCIISENRIESQKGIFTRQIDWVSLNCVLDIQLHQSFIQRILGVGTITVRSTDKITPLLEVPHVPRVQPAFDFLQQQLNRRSKMLSVVR